MRPVNAVCDPFGVGRLSPSGATAFYDTEMLGLTIEGTDPLLGPFQIRESPTLPSLGGYSVETLSSGPYRIGSFFDVFTELSLDGGQTWTPSQGSSHLTLVPEPSTSVLLILGSLLLAAVASSKNYQRPSLGGDR